MAKEELPRDIESEFPWGIKTPTYKAWLVLFAINAIALSAMFLAYVEVPALLGQEHALQSLFEPRETDPAAELNGILLCIAIILGNFVTVLITKTVGGWLSVLEKKCWKQKCKWWCLCCNKWLCVLVSVLKWVTWIITVVATVATFVFTFTCNF